MLIRGIVLAMRPDWEVLEVDNGPDALQTALDSVFDYASIDINMPGMDGLTLAGHLRAECPQMRLCMLSANIQAASQQRAAELGAGFVRKPINKAAVIDLIRYFEAGT